MAGVVQSCNTGFICSRWGVGGAFFGGIKRARGGLPKSQVCLFSSIIRYRVTWHLRKGWWGILHVGA